MKDQSGIFIVQMLRFFSLVINLNIIFYTMAETPKQQFSRFPMNYPPFYPGINPEQLKHLQANLQRSNSPLPPPPGTGAQNVPLMNPRLYQHFANNMRMMPMPPMWPYMPYNRPPPMPMPGKQGLKNNNQQLENKLYMHPSMMPQPNPIGRAIEIPEDQKTAPKNRVEKQPRKSEKVVEIQHKKPPTIAQQAPTSPPVKNSLPKKQKQVRQPSVRKYEPLPGKKKQKKEYIVPQVTSQRETREKLQTIQKLMMLVMKDRPKRERVTKVGKDHQAIIPESFINEYEYQLKIKMEKKKQLMSRMITPQTLTA